uniref:Uncharacterized protein n=1 Tax=Arundo donax TaxID=35708 RepID=A0A0A9E2N4_ARUDO
MSRSWMRGCNSEGYEVLSFAYNSYGLPAVFSSGVSVVEIIPRNSEISSFDFSSQLRDFHARSRVISIGRSPRTS